MKKGCIGVVVVVVVVVVLGAVALAVVGLRANKELGLLESDRISHETLATDRVRLRIVLKPEKLTELLLPLLPQKEDLPAFVQKIPMEIEQLLPAFMPHEMAVLAEPDFRSEAVRLNFFVNERRGGPLIVQAVNESGLFEKLTLLEWDTSELVFEQRGVLKTSATLPIPEGLEVVLLDYWTHNPPAEALTITTEEHLLEGVLDNRNGDLLTLIGVFDLALGIPWESVQRMLERENVLEYLAHIEHIRVFMDLADSDTLQIKIHVASGEEYGPLFAPIINLFIFPPLKTQFKSLHGVDLDGQSEWREEESLLVGEYTAGNLATFIETSLAQVKRP